MPRINNPINKLLGFQWKKDFDKRKYISKINKTEFDTLDFETFLRKLLVDNEIDT